VNNMALFILDEARVIKNIEGIVRKVKRVTSGDAHHAPNMKKYEKTFLLLKAVE